MSEIEGIDYVVCQICGRKFKILPVHLARSHNMSKEDYLKLYPNSLVMSEVGIQIQKDGVARHKKTCLDKYGVENISQIDSVKQKKIDSSLEEYGVENVSQSDIVKDKMKETCLDRYGVEYPSQSEIIKQRKIKTSLENYGVEYPSQSDIIKQRKIETSLENYGTEYTFQAGIIKDKIKATLMDRYGVEHPAQSMIVRNKMKMTTMGRFGVENAAQSEEIQDKIKATNLDRYGVEYTVQLDRVHKLGLIAAGEWRVSHPEEVKANGVRAGIASRISQVGKLSSIELKVQNMLIDNNYKFETQLPLLNICIPDIIFKDEKIIIQCDGDYWHNYPDGLDRDHHQDEILEKNGWKVIRFWEHEINDDIEGCLYRFELEYYKLSSIQLRQ